MMVLVTVTIFVDVIYCFSARLTVDHCGSAEDQLCRSESQDLGASCASVF